MYNVKLEKFEGPLDLLLQLIEQENLDINQIALAKIADEFVQYVNQSSGIPLDELADFLLVASKLIYIKSKSLLPYLVWGDEEDEAVGLEDQLKLYKSFLDASKKIEGMIKDKNYLYARERIVIPKGFYPPLLRPPSAQGYGAAQQGSAGQAQKIMANRLRDIFAEILRVITPIINIQKKIKENVVSIRQKIDDLKMRIGEKARVGFRDFVKSAKNKTEVIVSFLALLELIKQKIVSAEQDELFSDITIRNNNGS